MRVSAKSALSPMREDAQKLNVSEKAHFSVKTPTLTKKRDIKMKVWPLEQHTSVKY